MLRRALAPTFPAGALVFFIPWRVVAENPARRISTCRLTRTRRLVGAAAVGRTMVMSPAAPDFFVVIFRVGADAGARAIGATADAAANEPRGPRRRHPGSKAVLTGVLRRALAPTFPAGALVFFIPWRVVAENPARRISTCRLTRTRRLVGAAAVGRTMVMSPAAPDFFVVIFRVGADAGARAIGATANEPRGRRRRHPGSKAVLTGDAAACSRSDISGWRAGVLYPLAGGGRESGAAQ